MPVCQVCNQDRVCQLSFSVTDRWCGLCGQRLRHVRSPLLSAAAHQQTPWLYPRGTRDGRAEYVLPVCMDFADETGRLREGMPLPQTSDVPLTGNLRIEGQTVALRGFEEGARSTKCRLQLPTGLAVPPQGIEGEVCLEGVFGSETLTVRLYQTPQLAYWLKETDYLHSEQRAEQRYTFWKKATFEVQVMVETWHAPLRLAGPPRLLDPPAGVALIIDPNLQVLNPGNPVALRVQLDTTQWREDQEYRLEIELPSQDFETSEATRLLLRFYYLDLGDLRIEPDKIHIPQLMWGQDGYHSLTLTNHGGRELPALKAVADQPWIQLARGTEAPTSCVFWEEPLAADASENLEVTLDATRLSPLAAAQQLKGSIRFCEVGPREHKREWPVKVIVDALLSPPVVRVLAVDLGSSNTCAAFCKPERPDTAPALVPLEKDDQTDGNADEDAILPSVIYFSDVTQDPPLFEVGSFALAVANLSKLPFQAPDAKKLASLVKDAKRWVGSEGFRQRVVDTRGGQAEYSPEELVYMLLRGVLKLGMGHCLPKNVMLSFPTKFSRPELQAYDRICKRLDREMEQRAIPVRFRQSFDETSELLDEASAAIVSLLYSGADRPEDVPHEDNFLLASVDWGGGTLDIALMELTRTVERAGDRFDVICRGFFGDLYLGGNDVTNAGAVWLHEKLSDLTQMPDELQQLLRERGIESAEIPIVWPNQVAGGDQQGRENYHLLWLIAERAKIRLSDADANDQAPDLSEAESEPDSIPAQCLGQLWLKPCWSSPVEPTSGSFWEESTEGQPRPLKRAEYLRVSDLLLELSEQRDGVQDAFIGVWQGWLREIRLEDFFNTLLPGEQQSVSQRLEFQLAQLKQRVQLCNRFSESGLNLGYVLLAGSGSRFPLLKSALQASFPDARPICNAELAKKRVAVGLALYAEMRLANREFFRGFVPPHQLITDWWGTRTLIENRSQVQPQIPAGTSWKLSPEACREKLSFSLQPSQIQVDPRTLTDHTGESFMIRRWLALFSAATDQEVGLFDLNTALNGSPLPEPLAEESEYSAWFALQGKPRLQLYVEVDGQKYGPFELYWTDYRP